MEEKNPRCTRSWLILPVSPMTVTVGPTACRVPGGPDGVKIVHLQRTPTYGLGIKITEHAEPGCKGCVIKAINNPALEQAGVLRVGQKICTVNGTRVDTMTLVQLTDMFKSLGSAQVGVVATDYMPPRITGTLKKKVNLFIAPIDIPAFNELDICATKRTAIDAAYCRILQFFAKCHPHTATTCTMMECSRPRVCGVAFLHHGSNVCVCVWMCGCVGCVRM
eukprot:m.290973 g.290973  ORF g.290973 m.290973 type:complete len:221 (+) comp19976_c0_seq39:1441-2103(+)